MPTWPTRTSVCTASGLLTTITAGSASGGVDERARPATSLRSQSPNTFLTAVERFLGGHVADDGEDRVVGHEILLVERDDVVPRDAVDASRRAGLRHAVGMEAVDEPIEHGVGDVLGILEADLQAGQHLLPLAIDLLRRERRMPRHVRQHAHAGVEAVLHHDHVEEGQVGAGAGAHGAADEVDRVGDLARPTWSSVP